MNPYPFRQSNHLTVPVAIQTPRAMTSPGMDAHAARTNSRARRTATNVWQTHRTVVREKHASDDEGNTHPAPANGCRIPDRLHAMGLGVAGWPPASKSFPYMFWLAPRQANARHSIHRLRMVKTGPAVRTP